jgi:hypothetical protein
METHKTWFEISNIGWKRMNAGRPLGHLVREAVSNVFDAPGVTQCVIVASEGEIAITDDAPYGIADKSLVTTVFMTDKEDSHLMRGRKGRGLKELIAASTSSTVETVGYTVKFYPDGTRAITDGSSRFSGTTVHVKNEEWTRDTIRECVDYLSKFLPPKHITMLVNGKTVEAPAIKQTIAAESLPTTVIKDGKQVEINAATDINVRHLRKGEKKGWVYEMGIPVQEIETKFHLDVQQRIPMNDNRDVVDAKYLPRLYAAVMAGTISEIEEDELTEKWVLTGLNSADWTTQRTYVSRLVPEGTCIKSDDKIANDKARQQGIKLIDLSMLPSDTKWTIGYHGKDAVKVMDEIDRNCQAIDYHQLRATHVTFVNVMEYLGQKLLEKPIHVTFMSKPKSYKGNVSIADFTAGSRTMRWNIEAPTTRFDQPLHPENLTTLVHELAHNVTPEHNELFLEEVQTLAGKLAVLCLTYQQTLYRMVADGADSVATASPKRNNSPKGMTAVRCGWVGCDVVRMVKPQDVWQVKYCHEHQKQHQRLKARERRAGRT